MVESALAWNCLLNSHEPELALRNLVRASRDLARRDVDHWLRIRVEFIEISERITGRVEAEERRKLGLLASHYQATAIVAAAQPRTQDGLPVACV